VQTGLEVEGKKGQYGSLLTSSLLSPTSLPLSLLPCPSLISFLPSLGLALEVSPLKSS